MKTNNGYEEAININRGLDESKNSILNAIKNNNYDNMPDLAYNANYWRAQAGLINEAPAKQRTKNYNTNAVEGVPKTVDPSLINEAYSINAGIDESRSNIINAINNNDYSNMSNLSKSQDYWREQAGLGNNSPFRYGTKNYDVNTPSASQTIEFSPEPNASINNKNKKLNLKNGNQKHVLYDDISGIRRRDKTNRVKRSLKNFSSNSVIVNGPNYNIATDTPSFSNRPNTNLNLDDYEIAKYQREHDLEPIKRKTELWSNTRKNFSSSAAVPNGTVPADGNIATDTPSFSNRPNTNLNLDDYEIAKYQREHDLGIVRQKQKEAVRQRKLRAEEKARQAELDAVAKEVTKNFSSENAMGNRSATGDVVSRRPKFLDMPEVELDLDKYEKIKAQRQKQLGAYSPGLKNSKYYTKDSPIGKLVAKHRRRKISKKNSERREKTLKRKEKEAKSKNNQGIISNYENMQSRLDDYSNIPSGANSEAIKAANKERSSIENFMNDKGNYFDYKNAQLDEANNYGTWAWQKDKNNLSKERKAYEQQVATEKAGQIKKDKAFATDYIEKENNLFNHAQENGFGPYSEEEFKKYSGDADFISSNQEQYNNISSDIKLEALNDMEIKNNTNVYEARKNRLNAKHTANKRRLSDVNKEIRQLKNYKADYYTEEAKKVYQEKLNNLLNKKASIKSEIKQSRQAYRTASSPSHLGNDITALEKEIKNLGKLDQLEEAKASLNAGKIEKGAFESISEELFPGGNIPKTSGRTKEEISKEITENKKIIKHLTGKAHEAPGDIVDTFKSKMKNANKLTIATSVIAGVSQYKDARKEGKSVVGSVVRAGVDFALSETLGKAYLPLQLIKSAPSMAIKGAEMLHKEVRGMNTASRFTIFGEGEFRDTDQLATMRQSGMELAKASQYRLEQTLMGSEAKYLHR